MGSPPPLPVSSEPRSDDRAGTEFWDSWWEKSELPPPIDPFRRGLKNYPFRRLHQYFQKAFCGHPTQGKKLIEIGCAQSVMLPYFGKYFGFEIHGIDRSEIGCQRARTILEREQVQGKIHCGDFFLPPQHLLGQFDVVFSQGVLEHFEKTAEAVKSVARLLNPEGRMMTNIPNITGALRAYQKVLDRAIYDVQVPLDRESLALAHQNAGLQVESCEYFLPISLEVLNLASWRRGLPYWFTIRTHGVISRLVWLVDEHLVSLKPNRLTSPHIHCIARRPPA
jgi:2-polyprenyl-3-methyl-5-hydroxy-6-metoxy-1,4-benzoquinol methylase